jgi:flavin-dependent dehydrogenase
MTLDLIVAGAGPVGLSAAIAARLRGLSVVVIDPHEGTIDKACGEGLMPATLDALASIGVARPHGLPFPQIRYLRDGVVATGTLPSPGLGVRRTTLHAAIDARAAEVGVVREVGRVTKVEQDADGVIVDGRRARWLIAADGMHSSVRRSLGLDAPAPGAQRYGLRQHFAVAPWSKSVDVYWADDAEAYVTPVADDLVGVALLFGDAARARIADGKGPAFDRILSAFPELRARLSHPATLVRGVGPFQTRSTRRVDGHVLLAGDAAGYIDAITGEGTKVGILAGIAAANAIADGTPEAYEAQWSALFRSYSLATTGLLKLTGFGPTRRILPRFLRTFPFVFDAALGVLAD